jgi:hypothetical protein
MRWVIKAEVLGKETGDLFAFGTIDIYRERSLHHLFPFFYANLRSLLQQRSISIILGKNLLIKNINNEMILNRKHNHKLGATNFISIDFNG